MTMTSINLEPAEPILDGRHLAKVLGLWLEDCCRRLPSRTITSYEDKLARFFYWWTENGPRQNWELRQADLERYAHDLSTCKHIRTGKPLQWHSRKDYLRRLRSALLWAHRKGYTGPLNCALWIPSNPEGSAQLKKTLPNETMAKLMYAAGKSSYALRDQAVLAVFIGTGARLGEVAGLQIEDITFGADLSGMMHIRNAKHVRNREVVQRIACFDKLSGYYLMRWIRRREEEQHNAKPQALWLRDMPITPLSKGPLWIDVDGHPLTGQGLYKIVARHAETAGVSTGGIHSFRRTFITHWAKHRRGESDYHLLRMQVGHVAQGTTAKYYDLRSVDDIATIFISPMPDVVSTMHELLKA